MDLHAATRDPAGRTESDSIALPGGGVAMPMVGLGTFQAKGEACYTAVLHALKVGAR